MLHAFLTILFSTLALAQDNGALPPLQIRGTGTGVLQSRDLDGTKLLAAKKATLINREQTPDTPQNSYRQTLAQIPGMLFTEVNNESWASMNYRGLGDPHESYNILLLRDNLPIAADPYGYPASYYVPPADAVERIDFIRGGSGLLFGPQPGGVLNFQLRSAPARDHATVIRSKNTYGSYQTYSTYNEVSAGYERFSYLVSLHHRQSDGFRNSNSDYAILNPRVNLNYRPSAAQKITFDADYYMAEHGEPGGLAHVSGAGVLGFDVSRKHNTLQHDRINVQRGQYTLGYDYAWSDGWLTEARVWSGRYDRSSFRQAAAITVFGGVPTATTNTIDTQIFFSRGADVRNLLEYTLFDQPQNLTFGASYLHIDSPYTSDQGSSPNARGGERRKEMERSTESMAVFAENQFRYRDFSLVPGVRFEATKQNVNEKLNVGSAVPLRNKELTTEILLLGLGAQYQVTSIWQAYGNISQGFKPPTFTTTVPTSTGATISEDIEPAKTMNHELGARAQFMDGYLDASVFLIKYTNQFGQVGTNFQNIGSGEHKGLDLAIGHRVFGHLSGYANASWLSARYVDAAANGKTPAYAPGYIYRLGLEYRREERWRIQLQTQIVDQHYGNDNNTAQFVVPDYTVWDLAGQFSVGRVFDAMDANIRWGVQNLADRKYFARVRANGIEPAQPRTFYGGLALTF